MRIRFRSAPLLACLALAACATGLPTAEPSEIPSLRQRLAVAPDDVETRTRLGIALYRDGAFDEAARILEEAIAAGASGGAAHLYLGLAHEEMERWGEARAAYAAFLDAGGAGPLQDDIRGRLALMGRRELQAAAREALAREAQLSAEAPAPRSVAVFPFRLVSDSDELAPLQVALADMMITDLTLAGDLTVLQRARIQTLLDEMALAEAGYTEPATGARAGRLLRAEHVVQGALTTLGDALRFDADVLNTERGSAAGEVSGEDRLEAIFDLEKQVVFEVLDVLGVDITPAEREAIDENRAENLLSFLAYGRALQAMDRGDYAAANQFFQQSLELGPGFQPAVDGSSETTSMADAAGTPPGDVPGGGGGLTGAPDPGITGLGLPETLAGIDNAVNPSPTTPSIDQGSTEGGSQGEQQQGQQRDPVQESGGQETPSGSQTATIRIEIPRPGGGL